ncbi:MAG: DUF1080 domain-containing protein [Gemmatimonadetes bacterium]|nr:DUF1080 domain-containing protein [Gemmatimonadota bacterium]
MRTIVTIAGILVLAAISGAGAQAPSSWPVHSTARPRPPVVDPGPAAPPSRPPSDAVVLFDGTDLSSWRADDGGPARWRVGGSGAGGWFEVVPGTGSLVSAASFGDVQLHIEWASPRPVRSEGQDRGNSGVYLMDTYEVQVLDSYENPTYADGQAAAFYGQHPPLMNATRPPGEWQSYDIVFRAPRFDAAGRVTRPARVTVLHNGVLVHDAVELTGPTAHEDRPPYEAHAPRLPISLQDHGAPVRYRNIWVRDLSDG